MFLGIIMIKVRLPGVQNSEDYEEKYVNYISGTLALCLCRLFFLMSRQRIIATEGLAVLA